MSVTSFADYLRSPYAFYLRHVLRAETVDDSAREMDGRCFGSLAHEVFQAFGRGEAKDSTDPKRIAEALKRALDALALAQFGRRPWPAVELQVAQFSRRLEFFAEVQARRAADGWRIVEVEWTPSDPVALELGGGESSMFLRGKIDRIDAREKPGSTEREWAILDYKTGSKASDPTKHLDRSGAWKDLQLPLYTLLARGIAQRPQLGIFSVGKDAAETGIRFAAWDESVLESAFEAARDVARKVRRGVFFDLGDDFPDDPILLAIAGRGLVASAAPEGEGEEGGEDAA
jgi:ATP-dependent helicase/DNAse subunit B